MIVLLWHLLLWVVAILIVTAVVLRITKPQLYNKWLQRVVNAIEYRDPVINGKERTHVAPHGKLDSRTNKVLNESKDLNMKLSNALKEIESLKRKNEQLSLELETVRQTDSEKNKSLRTNYDEDRHQHEAKKNQSLTVKSHTVTSPEVRDANNQSNSNLSHRHQTLYAFAPTSAHPYGFNDEDWSTNARGQPFLMLKISDTEAKFTLNNDVDACRSLLSSLAYYNRLIDYEDSTHGQKPVSKVKVIESGLLHKNDDVWTIIHKIKILIN